MTTSAARTAATASGQARGWSGTSHTRCTRPGVDATATWPRMRCARAGSAPRPVTSASMSSGSVLIGSTRPRTPRRPATASSAATGSPSVSISPAMQQVAHRVAGQRADAAEAVLHEGAPPAAQLVVGGQRGHRHPQVARREQAQLAAQPAGRAAVVGHGDDGGDVVGEQAQRGQRGVQPVAAAERDGLEPGWRWAVCSFAPQVAVRDADRHAGAVRLSRRAISSLMATLRCLPPVQPMETVR